MAGVRRPHRGDRVAAIIIEPVQGEGGVIPAQDYDALRQAGAAAIFGPGTNIPHSAKVVLTELDRRLGLELFK